MTYQNSPGQPNQGYYAPVGGQSTNTMAIVALVSSLVFAPLGIIFGHIARGQIKRTGEGGAGLALAGLIIGYVFTIISIVVITLVMIGVFMAVKEVHDHTPTFTDTPTTTYYIPSTP